MDINFSAEDLAFRDEVRDFFATEFDAETAHKLSGVQTADYKPAIVSWQKKTQCQGLDRAGLAERVWWHWLECDAEVYL